MYLDIFSSLKLACRVSGIWIRDIRFKSNLLLTQVNKILKNLESKKLIKAVKSVAVSKHFLCFWLNQVRELAVTICHKQMMIIWFNVYEPYVMWILLKTSNNCNWGIVQIFKIKSSACFVKFLEDLMQANIQSKFHIEFKSCLIWAGFLYLLSYLVLLLHWTHPRFTRDKHCNQVAQMHKIMYFVFLLSLGIQKESVHVV